MRVITDCYGFIYCHTYSLDWLYFLGLSKDPCIYKGLQLVDDEKIIAIVRQNWECYQQVISKKLRISNWQIVKNNWVCHIKYNKRRFTESIKQLITNHAHVAQESSLMFRETLQFGGRELNPYSWFVIYLPPWFSVCKVGAAIVTVVKFWSRLCRLAPEFNIIEGFTCYRKHFRGQIAPWILMKHSYEQL